MNEKKYYFTWRNLSLWDLLQKRLIEVNPLFLEIVSEIQNRTGSYSPCNAQIKYLARRKNCKPKQLLANSKIHKVQLLLSSINGLTTNFKPLEIEKDNLFPSAILQSTEGYMQVY